MYRLSLVSVLTAAVGLAGCASTESSASEGAITATAKESGEMVTGSRISRTSTGRLIKSTVQDKAAEPALSMGNVVGAKGN